ncbi:TrkH family potassium uptake protein [Bariatricus massiliensis]|uniref:TrkH family potassium uptake protein n=1 Tax=Bariatricus massiliensis TaxID=1745713 RepID=A0ABS8DDW9_9FIRM|nr:TrkH family potassium uptake protein [Bariatricus massiliensis]MCB7302729.1 TrkH family potassium uptake protein [Bariatricus massiliensis]MCB7373945.1 TrkH family potassium uptake protein [Bariatricus massiliensis]MCB7386615.1 TrkH family potassium uptake protein [Bariatricus massiliensis]MCB7410777.1 TrkH family potassium uptake protein [Bariatricus massiliensis]MCQ5251602.1 TrkH family potassium uptake protein [Bariatricus massiliensis]
MQLLYKKLTQTQMIVIGYVLIILLGSIFLMLPISSREGVGTPFLDALFTSTSSACVTGLIVVDTWTHWSLFGQVVILVLIQIGGMGFMTLGVYVAIVLRRKIGLRTRGILQESINSMQIGGIVKLAKKIMKGTILFESVGALMLALRFIPKFGFWRGVWYGIFHSVSAFCNAGFDLMGCEEQYGSFTAYAGDWIINLVIMALIIIGGIGFFVWNDVTIHKFDIKRYSLHTKIVLLTTGILIFSGAALFYLIERNHILADMSTTEQIFSSFFNSVTARTAGFNTTDTAALQESSKFLTMILMFIGGSPGSTAGGIKTTTLVVLAVYVKANLKQQACCNVFNRRLDDGAIRKASTVLCTNLFLTITATMVLMSLQSFGLTDTLFEVISAMGTVGMSTGITRDICAFSQVVLIFLMYCGRIGSLTFALSLRGHKHDAPVKQPAEKIMIG